MYQVRIHLGESGTTLCGERVYDRRVIGRPLPDGSGAGRVILHAARLGFDYPTTGKRTVRMGSWEARPPGGRIGKSAALDWQTGVWYTAKLTVEQKEKTAVVRGKVWKKGDPEPSEWTLEFEDPSPNREGAATLYGYISNITDTQPGAEIYYDNVSITPNAKK